MKNKATHRVYILYMLLTLLRFFKLKIFIPINWLLFQKIKSYLNMYTCLMSTYVNFPLLVSPYITYLIVYMCLCVNRYAFHTIFILHAYLFFFYLDYWHAHMYVYYLMFVLFSNTSLRYFV